MQQNLSSLVIEDSLTFQTLFFLLGFVVSFLVEEYCKEAFSYWKETWLRQDWGEQFVLLPHCVPPEKCISCWSATMLPRLVLVQAQY